MPERGIEIGAQQSCNDSSSRDAGLLRGCPRSKRSWSRERAECFNLL